MLKPQEFRLSRRLNPQPNHGGVAENKTALTTAAVSLHSRDAWKHINLRVKVLTLAFLSDLTKNQLRENSI